MLNRRSFIGSGSAAVAGCALSPAFGEGVDLPAPTPAQVRWQDCEIGLVYHFDMPIAAGNFAANNAVREVFDPKLYHPTRLDTDQWIEAAKACGAKYAVFTATHFNGFLQWQSDLYPYGVKQAAWRGGKGDVVKDFVESCRKAGILPGLYFSTHRNVVQTVWDHYVDWGKGRATEKQVAFNRIAEGMLEELCSRYGNLVQIWFDAGVKLPHEGGPDMLPIFEKHQPDSVFYHSSRRSDHRWIGNENGSAPYPCWATMPRGDDGSVGHNSRDWIRYRRSGMADGTVWSPGMADTPLRKHNWFWKPGEDDTVHLLPGLMNRYYYSVGHNCNLLLGEVVTPDGLVPQHDLDRLTEFGREIRRRFEKPVAETSGAGNRIELPLPEPQRINHLVVMEDIVHGERVRRFRLEGLTPGGAWKPLCEGSCIGHKRIQHFPAIEVSALRLLIDETRANTRPLIRRFAVYNVTA